MDKLILLAFVVYLASCGSFAKGTEAKDPKCTMLNVADRKKCHEDEDVTLEQCIDKGCCWQPNNQSAWCFHPMNETPSKCIKEKEVCGDFFTSYGTCCDGLVCEGRPTSTCRKPRKSRSLLETPSKCAIEGEWCGGFSDRVSCCNGFKCHHRVVDHPLPSGRCRKERSRLVESSKNWKLALTMTPALLICLCLMDTENKFLIQNNKIYKRNGGINVATVKKFSICYSSFLPQQFIQHFHSIFWWQN